MMVNVAPEATNSHETLCSLRFAKQVNQCDTKGKGGGGGGDKRSVKPLPPKGEPSNPAAGNDKKRPATAAPAAAPSAKRK